MEILISIGILLFFLASLILPWVLRSHIGTLQEDMRYAKEQIAYLRAQLPPAANRGTPETIQASAPPAPLPVETKPQAEAANIPVRKSFFAEIPPAALAPLPDAAPAFSFEQQFGARLPVWIGGIALALAGFYLVKYSIDMNLLTPWVRVLGGLAFGVAMLLGGNHLRLREGVANGERIAQALCGAGIADLYICLFAASSLYGLIPGLLGFIGMAGVTGIAVVLSVRHGAPIALLGLIGGFLTPALIHSSEPNALLLFSYLYAIFTGLFVVIRKQGWWWLSLPAVIGTFAWVGLWMVAEFIPGDGIWLGLFLIAICATVVNYTKEILSDASFNLREGVPLPNILTYLTLGGSMLLMCAVTAVSHYGSMEWGMYFLLSAGSIALSFFRPKAYGFAPWGALAISALMLVTWRQPEIGLFTYTLLSFAALFTLGGYALLWRAENPVSLAALSGAAAIGYFLIGYAQLRTQVDFAFPLWGMIALGLGLASVNAVRQVMERFPEEDTRQKLLAVFSLAATAFIALGLTIELRREFLSVALSMELLAVCWLNLRFDIKALRPIAAALACAFGAVLLPQILLLVQLTSFSLLEVQLRLQDTIPLVKWPLFQLGLPGALFAASSLLLRRRQDGKLVKWLEVSAIALIGVMGYYLMRHAFHVNENVLFAKAGFIERGAITNALILFGLACLAGGNRINRHAVAMSGLMLCAVGAFRIGYFDLFLYNPLWAQQNVGSWPLLNGLLLPYGLPIAWVLLAARELPAAGKTHWVRYTGMFALALLFTFVSLNVTQLFRGAYLDQGHASLPEIYSYSFAWLLLGIFLLFFGTLRGDKTMRTASLFIMILTAGKVFLYDASALSGLLRVFSFFGLGVSLLGLSWFYTRFVFGGRNIRS